MRFVNVADVAVNEGVLLFCCALKCVEPVEYVLTIVNQSLDSRRVWRQWRCERTVVAHRRQPASHRADRATARHLQLEARSVETADTDFPLSTAFGSLPFSTAFGRQGLSASGQ